MRKGTLVFEYGADGGGAGVYRSDSGKIVESGSAGGMLDEEEDPIRSWTKEFGSFEDWWKDFKNIHRNFWPYFYPMFIHDDIKDFIRKEIAEFKSDDKHSNPSFESWMYALEGKNRF